MRWQVRRASLDDASRLALIGATTFLETFAGILDGSSILAHCKAQHSSRTYERYLEAGGAGWLAETTEGAAPVGYAVLGPSLLPGTNTEGGDLELKRIYSLSRFHGTGLGPALLDNAVEFAFSKGAKRVLLGVFAGNERAQAFYRKNGFSRVADRRFKVGHREYYDIVFAKNLDVP